MFKFHFLFSVFFILSVSYAQEQFNVVYPHEMSPNARTIFTLSDTGYATVGGAIVNNWGISITITDTDGSLIDTKYYDKDNWKLYQGVENNCFMVGNKYYISGGATKPTGDYLNPVDSAYIHLSSRYFKYYSVWNDTNT